MFHPIIILPNQALSCSLLSYLFIRNPTNNSNFVQTVKRRRKKKQSLAFFAYLKLFLFGPNMSVLEYPDAFNAEEVQIWNNAAFDNGESEDSFAFRPTWSSSSIKPMLSNLSESLESEDFSKENRTPSVIHSPMSLKSSISTNPLCPNSSIENRILKQEKIIEKPGLISREDRINSRRNIDTEIEEIEKEISRLSSKLNALRLEKAEQNAKTIEKPRGRVVPAKFMEQKQNVKDGDKLKKSDESCLSGAKSSKFTRRGMSMGPVEIIGSGINTRVSNKSEITPVLSVQNRRKSCFWKLEEIDELKATKQRRQSMSASPRSRKTATKVQPHKHALTTIGSKKSVKKQEAFVNSIQPKKLFKEGEKSVPAKKTPKPGRIVASRYNQMTVSAARKRSFPENEKEETERIDKRRVSCVGKAGNNNQGNESKVKKKWEIPSEIVVFQREEDIKDKDSNNSTETPLSIGKISDVLPKIRTFRNVNLNDSPRDSGPAKRVAELVERKQYFGDNEEMGLPFCQALSFIEDAEEEE